MFSTSRISVADLIKKHKNAAEHRSITTKASTKLKRMVDTSEKKENNIVENIEAFLW